MGNLIDELHNDHIKCSKVLDLLAEQLDYIHTGKSADYNLMLDAVCYLENYPDYVLSPLEEVIFEESIENKIFKELYYTVKRFRSENHELKVLTRKLHDYIEAVLEDRIFEKEPFERQLETCIQRQRDHMYAEESQIFPLLRKKLSPHQFHKAH